MVIGVEADDEDTVHGDEKAGQLGDVVAAVATVQRNVEQVLERLLRLRVHVDVVARTPARVHHSPSTGCRQPLLLARITGQYCYACCRLSASVVCRLLGSSVVVCKARGRSAAAGPGWAGRVAGPAADTARRDSTVTSR